MQDLIRSCVKPCELESDLEKVTSQIGEYHGGCNLDKLHDYSVFAM